MPEAKLPKRRDSVFDVRKRRSEPYPSRMDDGAINKWVLWGGGALVLVAAAFAVKSGGFTVVTSSAVFAGGPAAAELARAVGRRR